MRLIRRQTRVLLTVTGLAALFFTGCDRELRARIDATRSGGFSSTLGLVDRSGLALGSLFVVDPTTMTARGVGTYEPVRYEQQRLAKVASRRERITSDLAIDFASDAKIPSGWEPFARRLAARSGEIEAFGYETTSILNVELYLEDRTPLHEAARAALGSNPGIFYLVTSVGHADSVRVGLEGGVRTGMISRLNTPEGSLVVEAPELGGAGGVHFVRCTAYRFAADDGVLELDPSADLDLSRVDLSRANVPTR